MRSETAAWAGLVTVALALVLSTGEARAQSCPANDRWPSPDWPSRTEEFARTRGEQIRALEEYAFTLQGADEDRIGVRTDGVVVIHRGEIVYERYARGFTAEKRHLAWSVSKSFINALVGRGVLLGELAVEDSICKHAPDLPESHCGITLRHLLEFASGLDWKETYEGQSNQASSVLAMLYGKGWRDMAAFVASHAPRDPPGESWAYSSGDTTLLSSVIGRTLSAKHGERWPWVLLFDRIGMRRATWERDAKGNLVGSSYLYAPPRELAKLGYLYLHGGCWNGERLLPEDWIARSTQVSEPLLKKPLYRDAGDVQGWQFWLNRPVPSLDGDARPHEDLPEDMYAARGHWGQQISVYPSEDLVVVRVADDRDGSFDFNRFGALVLAMVRAP